MWWRCAKYFVIASCGKMPTYSRCVYMSHVCFYIGCSDCVGSVGMFVVYRSLLKIVGF